MPSISASTSAAVVGLGLPERFAEGAASGTPVARMTASATGWLGIRTDAVSSPAHTESATVLLRGSMSVSGPGQNASASR